MTLRIEFPWNRSTTFARTVGICRAVPSFKQTGEGKAAVYSVEFNIKELDSANAVMDMIQSYRGKAFYIDGKLASRSRVNVLIFENLYRTSRAEREEADRRRDLDKKLQLAKIVKEAKSPKDLFDPNKN